jgi:conjugal transfer mating pair stabilization protein TraG
VFRDLGLGIYSKEDLIQAPNILTFLAENTSRIRTVNYKEISTDNSSSTENGFIPCREAIQKMNALFDKKTGNTKEILIGEISNDFQFLLKQKATGETELRNLIKQQIAINILKEEIPGTLNSFASKRAELLQKENQKILGALGANSIVAMRNFFEATIYMVFPLVVLLCLLSFGIKPLLNWTHFILWVNSWPPFYVVVKFLLNSIWEFRTKHTYGDSFGLTIFTSEGLTDLYSSMESIAAIAMAFIPFLSWILLKGGVSQMVQLASSLMSPAQSAASTAAAEKTYGNYNYGNMSVDNTNAYNAQTNRQTYSGFLSTGSVSLKNRSFQFGYSRFA